MEKELDSTSYLRSHVVKLLHIESHDLDLNRLGR